MHLMPASVCLLGCAASALCLTLAPAPLPRRGEDKIQRLPMGRNVTLELEGRHGRVRRVIIAAEVCLREGDLEHLMTRRGKKEHEAILAADVDTREVHTALLAAGATAGAPARFNPAFAAARGHPIDISLEWQVKGVPVRARAQQWVRDKKAKQPMAQSWVFAGSAIVVDPQNPNRPQHLANEGDVICVANFEGALLDVPARSSNQHGDLAFEAWTKNIPPLGTRVNLILEPVREAK